MRVAEWERFVRRLDLDALSREVGAPLTPHKWRIFVEPIGWVTRSIGIAVPTYYEDHEVNFAVTTHVLAAPRSVSPYAVSYKPITRAPDHRASLHVSIGDEPELAAGALEVLVHEAVPRLEMSIGDQVREAEALVAADTGNPLELMEWLAGVYALTLDRSHLERVAADLAVYVERFPDSHGLPARRDAVLRWCELSDADLEVVLRERAAVHVKELKYPPSVDPSTFPFPLEPFE